MLYKGSLFLYVQSRFWVGVLNCVHIFLSCKADMNKSESLEQSPLESDLSGGSDEQLLATGEKKKKVQTILLAFFHGIHHFCPGHHYLWYNTKGPSESWTLLEPFLEEGINIIPFGKMHTMPFLYHFFKIFLNLFWMSTNRYQLNWNTVEIQQCLQILVHISVAKMT